MNAKMIQKELELDGLAPVVVIDDAENAVPLANALLNGGIWFMEITFRTAAAKDAIKNVVANVPKMIVGAGTVLNVEMAKKQLKLRCLPKTVEKFRLKEIKEQVELFENNINIQNKFDYIISNNYTEESVNNAVELIKNIEERRCVSEISG